MLYALALPHSSALAKLGVLGVGLIVAAGTWIAGGFLGFLFAIPKSTGRDSAGADSGTTNYQANSNLVEISDWLTKILVGLGLVELGRLTTETHKLVDFLKPSVGDQPSSSSFAFAVLVLFAVSGFLALYIVTRVYLGAMFARTDMSLSQLVSAKVVETQSAQSDKDAQALLLAQRQLEPEPGAPLKIEQNDLNAAVADASPVARTHIFELARAMRRKYMPADREKMERTAPVFLALIASDKDDTQHRYHGQLGYVLKDQRTPDFAGAERELTTAIKIRDAIPDRGYLLYEFNRAICRIELKATLDDVKADVVAAARSKKLREQIPQDEPFKSWLAANNLTLDQLLAGNKPHFE